jgi:hypothetical protein
MGEEGESERESESESERERERERERESGSGSEYEAEFNALCWPNQAGQKRRPAVPIVTLWVTNFHPAKCRFFRGDCAGA